MFGWSAQLQRMSCDIYANNSFWGTIAAAGFGVGILLSYVPQLVTLVRRQSTEGISPYFLLLMNLGSSFAFANSLVLSRPILSCCQSSISPFDCFGSLLGTLQLFAGFLGPSLILLLALRFEEPSQASKITLSAKIVAIANFISWLFVISVTNPKHAHLLATSLGLMALSVGFVQYIPQLYTTFRLQHTGSLSVTMMLFQIPGGFIWCLSLATRRGSHWSTWISTFAAACFQTLLLIVALYYTSRNSVALAGRLTPQPSTLPQSTPAPVPQSETTPLLPE